MATKRRRRQRGQSLKQSLPEAKRVPRSGRPEARSVPISKGKDSSKTLGRPRQAAREILGGGRAMQAPAGEVRRQVELRDLESQEAACAPRRGERPGGSCESRGSRGSLQPSRLEFLWHMTARSYSHESRYCKLRGPVHVHMC